MIRASHSYLQSRTAVHILCGLQVAKEFQVQGPSIVCAMLAIIFRASQTCCLHGLLQSLTAYPSPILNHMQ